jgi:hypothetical protein
MTWLAPQCISTIPLAPWPPPCLVSHLTCKWAVPPHPWMLPLPLHETELPRPLTAAAACVRVNNPVASEIATEYDITRGNSATVYMSPDPLFGAFEEDINLSKWSYDKHHIAGMALVEHNERLYLGNMIPGLSGAKVDKWRLYLRGAWLIQVGHTSVSTIADAHRAFKELYDRGAHSVTLLFSHPELRKDISNNGLPIISSPPFTQLTHDQLSHHWDFDTVAAALQKTCQFKVVECGHVLNYVTRVMRLTWGKLLRQDDWSNWQASEFLQ